MSEPTIAAVEAAAGPLVSEAEKALAPEAEKVLTDLHAFVTGEADRLRQELPGLVQEGVDHLHALGASILGRYQAVMERIDAHLTGTVQAAPTTTPSTPTPTPAPADSPAAAASAAAASAPAAPAADPTPAPEAPTTTIAGSSSSSSDSSTAATDPATTLAADPEPPASA